MLNLSDRGLSDDRLNHLLSVAPQQSIILLEDVDAAFVSREDSPQMKSAYEGLSRVTFSGLLNAVDGVASSEARILFMTTNYLNRSGLSHPSLPCPSPLTPSLTSPTPSFLYLASPGPISITNNYIFHRLDGALIRPGRVDMKASIDHATRYQLEQMYQRFYPDEPASRSVQFAERTLSHGRNVSMAQIQGYFMMYKSDPAAVLEHTDKLWSM